MPKQAGIKGMKKCAGCNLKLKPFVENYRTENREIIHQKTMKIHHRELFFNKNFFHY